MVCVRTHGRMMIRPYPGDGVSSGAGKKQEFVLTGGRGVSMLFIQRTYECPIVNSK